MEKDKKIDEDMEEEETEEVVFTEADKNLMKKMDEVVHEVMDEDMTRVGPFRIRKTFLNDNHRKHLEQCLKMVKRVRI